MIKIRMHKVTPFLFTAALAIASFQTQAQVKIMAVGDSITAGFTFDQPDGTGLGTASYRKEFENLLRQSGCVPRMVGSRNTNDPDNPTVFVGAHEGYSGHRADHFITGNGPNPGIDAMMAAQSPDVVLLHLGSNDVDRNLTQAFTVDDTVDDIENIISKILSANGNATILVANVIPWFGRSNNPNITADIQRLGNRIATAVNSMGNPNVVLVDVRSGYTQNDMQQDLIHPNVDGENRIADAFATAFENSGVCAQFDNTDPATFISTPLPPGNNYRVYVLSVDNAGNDAFHSNNLSVLPVNRLFVVSIPDSTDPSAATTIPAVNSTIAPAVMAVSGTSFDADSGVDLVGVQIQRRDVSPIQYWDGQVWTAANPAIVAASVSANGSSWNLPNVDLTNAGSYRIRLRVQDNAGNLSLGGANLITNFIVDDPDNTAPTTTIESHINFDFILSAVTRVFGTSFDADSGVASVSVQIRRHTNLGLEFWDGSEWTNTNLFVNARVFSSGNRWSLPAVDLTTPGAYRIRLQARDNAGNVSLADTNPVTRFTVEAPDTTAPAATISSPANNDIISPVIRRIYGTSSDSQSGVKSVSVQVRRRANFTVQYWNGAAWQNESVFVFTDWQAGGTRWNFPRVDLTTPGTYRIRLRAEDFNGNVSLGGDNPITFFTVGN